MKTLSAQASQASGRRWAELIYLLELTLWRDKYGPAPVSLTLRLSDAPRTELGQEWLPLVVNWGNPGDALNPADPDVTVGSFDISITNDYPVGGRARFSDLFRHGLNQDATTYDILFGDAMLRLLFRGGTSGDEVLLFRFLIEEARNLTADQLTLRMSGVELVLENAEDCYRISTENFPLCDPEAVNAPLPIPFGRLKHQKVLGVVSGLVDKLAIEITATDPVNGGILYLSDPAVIERLPPQGLVQIDDEQIYYGGKNPSSVSLSGIGRGVNSTEATNHDAGSTVFQVLSEYLYLAGENRGGHLMHAITGVRSDGMLLAGTSYVIERANTTILPGRSVGVIRFPVKPIIAKQVTYQVEDRITVIDTTTVNDEIKVLDNTNVSDGIGVADGLGVGDNIGVSVDPTEADRDEFSTTQMPHQVTLGNPPGLGTTWEGTGQPNYYRTRAVSRITFNPPVGTPIQNWMTVSVQIYPLNAGGAVIAEGTYAKAWAQWGGIVLVNGSNTIYVGGQYFTAADFNIVAYSASGVPGVLAPGGYKLDITGATQRYRRGQSVAKYGGAYRGGGVAKTGTASKTGTTSKTGTVIKTGQSTKDGTVQLVGNSSADTVLGTITADVWGLTDDAAGTITTVPFFFMENPHDVVKCLLREVWQEKNPALYELNSWWATRALQDQEGYTWALMAVPTSFQEFRKTAGFQGRAELFQEGGRWVYKWRGITPAVISFDNRNLAGEVVVDWSPRTDLVTELDVGYDEHPETAGEWQQSLTLRSDLTRYRYRYGLQRSREDLGGRTLELPWVRNTTMATRLGTYWLAQWERARLRPKIRGFWDAIGVDKTDVIAINVPLITAYGPLQFAVRRKVYELDQGTLSFECEETDIPALQASRLAQYGLKFSASNSIPVSYRLGGPTTRAVAGAVRLRPTREFLSTGVYWLGGPRTYTLPSHLTVLTRDHERILDATYGIPREEGVALLATLNLGATRDVGLGSLYTFAANVFSKELLARYYLPVGSPISVLGLYRIGPFTRTVTLPGQYAAGHVFSLTRSASYRLPTTTTWTRSGFARYAVRQSFDRTLSAQYVLRIATWDAAATTWDSGLRWDPGV